MNDHDFEQLQRFFDGDLPEAEASDVEARLETDAEWQSAYEGLELGRSMLREPIRREQARTDFSGLWAGIEAALPAGAPAPGASVVPARTPAVPTREAGGWWRRYWGLVLLGAAAAAAVTVVWVRNRGGTDPPSRPPIAETRPPQVAPSAPTPVVPTQVEPEPEHELMGPMIAGDRVQVESVRSGGDKTVLISQPQEGGATVIWLLDGPDAGAAGKTPTGEDPI